MLNALIQLSLRNRALVLGLAVLLLALGYRAGTQLPLEVLPDLTKPTVTILTEAPGLAPEEVEARVSQPLENAVQGLPGIDRLRSTSDVALSLVFVEFAWGTDLVRARQQVQERLAAVAGNLPRGVRPGLTPASALLGEFMLVGLRSRDGKMPPRELRTLADWTLQRRLLAVPGVTEVLTMGGGILQIHVQPDPARLAAFGVTLEEMRAAVAAAAQSSAGGYLESGPQELMIRAQGMTAELRSLGQTVVKNLGDRRVLLSDVARLEEGIQPMRGDASVNGTPGVILSIVKAPGVDTLKVTRATEAALAALRPGLPAGVEAEVLFRQGDFIETAIGNLREAIRDGAAMVALVLLLFLVSLRPTRGRAGAPSRRPGGAVTCPTRVFHSNPSIMNIPRILTLLALAFAFAGQARAHGDVELGPNGGRLVEFGEKNPLHAEVVLKDGSFVIGLYDEATKKEVPIGEQEFSVTERNGGKKLAVEKKDGKWVVAKPAGKDFWLIFQLRDKAGAKARTGRLHYDETNCSECNNPEWLCKCEELKRAKGGKK